MAADLKIAVAQRRPPAELATPDWWESRELPDATARVMWAALSTAERFRRSWHARPRRPGLPATARLRVLGDGASWIRKTAGRSPTGCRQPLDVYHAPGHIASAGERPCGEVMPDRPRPTSTTASCCWRRGGRGLPAHRRGVDRRRHAARAKRAGPVAGLFPAPHRPDRPRGATGRRRGDRQRRGGGFCGYTQPSYRYQVVPTSRLTRRPLLLKSFSVVEDGA